MFNPRSLALLFYAFLGVMLFTNLPYNEYTLSRVIVIMALYVTGLVFLLASHYIIPQIKKSWKLGACKVHKSRYVICETGTSNEKVGYAFIKVVPEQPVADMDKERRESFLQTTMGLLAGTQFESMIAYIAVRDRYGENIKKRLEKEKYKLTAFGRESLRTREMLERIRRELDLLKSVPVILEGFYIAVVRDYGYSDYEVIQKLEADTRALMARLSGIGLYTDVMKGEELWLILKFMQFGSVTQVTW